MNFKKMQKNTTISVKEIEAILKAMRKRDAISTIKAVMERKAYWLKTGLREAYRTKGRLHHELFCLY